MCNVQCIGSALFGSTKDRGSEPCCETRNIRLLSAILHLTSVCFFFVSQHGADPRSSPCRCVRPPTLTFQSQPQYSRSKCSQTSLLLRAPGSGLRAPGAGVAADDPFSLIPPISFVPPATHPPTAAAAAVASSWWWGMAWLV